MTRRVLMLGSSGDLYGAPRVFASSAEVFQKAGWHVVVALPADGPMVQMLLDLGVEVHVRSDFALRRRDLHIRCLPGLAFRQLRLLAWLLRQRRQARFNLVYSSTLSVIDGPVAAAVLRCRHLWHVHEILESPRLLAILLARTAAIGSAIVICPSEAVRSHLAVSAPKSLKKSVVLPNCIDASLLKALAPPSRGAELRVGCIARLHAWKGQSVAVSAVAEARRRGVPVSLTLFGDVFEGNEQIERDLRKLVDQSGLVEHVHFAGLVNDQVEIYQSLDAVVVPSTSPEPFSLVCLEAQAAARPVVASDHGGPREILVNRQTGLLVEPGSATSLATALCELWNDPALAAAMGAAGRVRVLELYSPAVFAEGLMAIVERCLDGGGR